MKINFADRCKNIPVGLTLDPAVKTDDAHGTECGHQKNG